MQGDYRCRDAAKVKERVIALAEAKVNELEKRRPQSEAQKRG